MKLYRIVIRTLMSTCVLCLFLAASPLRADDPASLPGCAITEKTLRLPDGTVHYNRAGSGTPVLLLHGLFARKEQWNQVSCALAQAGFTTIAPDLPGYGDSRRFPLADYSLERQVVMLREFTSLLDLDTIELAGNSMGGTIAALYARRYPEHVDRIAFIGPPLGWVDWGPRLNAALVNGVNPFMPDTQEQLDLELSLLFARPPRLSPQRRQSLTREYRMRSLHYQQIWNMVTLSSHVLAQSRGVLLGQPRPALILWGEDDRIYPVSAAASLQQRIPGSQLVRLPDTGHLPMLEQPQETAQRLIGFLRAEDSPHASARQAPRQP